MKRALNIFSRSPGLLITGKATTKLLEIVQTSRGPVYIFAEEWLKYRSQREHEFKGNPQACSDDHTQVFNHLIKGAANEAILDLKKEKNIYISVAQRILDG